MVLERGRAGEQRNPWDDRAAVALGVRAGTGVTVGDWTSPRARQASDAGPRRKVGAIGLAPRPRAPLALCLGAHLPPPLSRIRGIQVTG